MANYKITFRHSATEELASLQPQKIIRQIHNRINRLAWNPRPRNYEKLQGNNPYYRVRQGQYRIIYQIDDSSRTLKVVKIGHRREVYRNLP